MSDPIVALKAWTCDVDDVNGTRTLVVKPDPSGTWEITSEKGVSPWVAGVNGCHSFSSEEAAKSVYDHVCGDQKWRRR